MFGVNVGDVYALMPPSALALDPAAQLGTGTVREVGASESSLDVTSPRAGLGDFSWVQGYHAINWFLDATRTMKLIEPQTDEIYAVDQCLGNVSLILV